MECVSALPDNLCKVISVTIILNARMEAFGTTLRKVVFQLAVLLERNTTKLASAAQLLCTSAQLEPCGMDTDVYMFPISVLKEWCGKTLAARQPTIQNAHPGVTRVNKVNASHCTRVARQTWWKWMEDVTLKTEFVRKVLTITGTDAPTIKPALMVWSGMTKKLFAIVPTICFGMVPNVFTVWKDKNSLMEGVTVLKEVIC